MTKYEALETKDEPVAWGMEKDGVILDVICPDEHEREEGEYTIPLYTTPQRTWVGLTDEEIENIYMETMNFQQNARALEAKLKDKNT
jgi:pyruvate/2-oxoglutarate dehydrogenase complex dihydrolipoamide dehydrogenase (E3) component